ncbi:MAG: hypothetical protein AAGC55_01070 [Myxococcota bacterium]
MIVEQDIINAAGSIETLVAIFNLGVADDPSTDPAYQTKIAYALDEARAVVTETLGITFDTVAMVGLSRDEVMPVVILASRYAVLKAKQRGRSRLEEESEVSELEAIPERLRNIAKGASWPGKVRPAAQRKIHRRFVSRSSRAPKGFFGS